MDNLGHILNKKITAYKVMRRPSSSIVGLALRLEDGTILECSIDEYDPPWLDVVVTAPDDDQWISTVHTT